MAIKQEPPSPAWFYISEQVANTCGIVLTLVSLFMGTVQASMASEDAWKREANQRIDHIRKADLTVRVVDAEGRPIAGVSVQVSMIRHAFPWGVCVTAQHITGQTPDEVIYRKKVIELFNCAVLENALKWNAWHGAYGPGFTREKTEAALKWLKENAFRIRGHCLVWPGWENLGPWGESLSSDLPQLRNRILDHIDALAAFTAPYVDEWDVVNEPVHENEVIQALGDACLGEWFSRARADLPDSCRLFINEYNIVEQPVFSKCDEYEAMISALLAQGVPLEGIGFQSHFQPPMMTSPQKTLAVFDRFARFGLPIVVTEFDVNLEDETQQARFTSDFMTAAFSHPACDGFIFWGFWEGSHWRPNAALFRKDWSEKPNLAVYRDLVFKEWWTDETGRTNENGEFVLRVFKGTHTLIVGNQEKAVEIGDSATKMEVIL